MGYAETRMKQDILQMKRALADAKDREQQTRRGCVELAEAMRQMILGSQSLAFPGTPRAQELIDLAGVNFAEEKNEG